MNTRVKTTFQAVKDAVSGDSNPMMDGHASRLDTKKKEKETSSEQPETVLKREEVSSDSEMMAQDILVSSWMILQWDGVDNTSATETAMKVTSDMVR